MDPITIGLMGLNFLDQQQQRKKQNALDQVEAKWSGFKGYNEYAPKAGTSSALTDIVDQGGWQKFADKLKEDSKLNPNQKAMQVDETIAAKALDNPESAPDVPEGYSQDLGEGVLDNSTYEIGGQLSEDQNKYLKMLRARQRMG